MIKFFSKKTLFAVLICFSAFAAKAQLGYNYSQYDIGVAGAITQVFGDVSTYPGTATVNLNFTYNQTPYTNFVFEAQFGKIKGGDSTKTFSRRQFAGTLNSFIFRAQLQAGELIDYSKSPVLNALKNCYASVGIGYAIDQITSIKRNDIYGTQYAPGENDAREPFIPLRFGYELKIFNQYDMPSVKIDLAYNINYILGDNLDGYSGNIGNRSKDIYTQISLGVKFAIGGTITSYRKQIQY